MTVHTVEIRVRYAETDQMGAVYNSHFLTYFEVGRTEYLRSMGASYRDLEARGAFLVVVEAHCRYLSPARYDDLLKLDTWVSRLRPARIDFGHRLRRADDGTAVAEGHLVLACVDEGRRPRRLPNEVREKAVVVDGPPPA